MSNLQQKIIKPKLGVLALAKQLGNVSAACKAMGYSRAVIIDSRNSMKMEMGLMKIVSKNYSYKPAV